jgi:hypothetical protein
MRSRRTLERSSSTLQGSFVYLFSYIFFIFDHACFIFYFGGSPEKFPFTAVMLQLIGDGEDLRQLL